MNEELLDRCRPPPVHLSKETKKCGGGEQVSTLTRLRQGNAGGLGEKITWMGGRGIQVAKTQE